MFESPFYLFFLGSEAVTSLAYHELALHLPGPAQTLVECPLLDSQSPPWLLFCISPSPYCSLSIIDIDLCPSPKFFILQIK